MYDCRDSPSFWHLFVKQNEDKFHFNKRLSFVCFITFLRNYSFIKKRANKGHGHFVNKVCSKQGKLKIIEKKHFKHENQSQSKSFH